MSNDFELDRRALDWLAEGPTSAPDRVVEASFAAASRVRQARAWSLVPWRDPMSTLAIGRPVRPLLPFLVILGLVIAAFMALLATGALRRPGPDLIGNGPVSFVTGDTGDLVVVDTPGSAPRTIGIDALRGDRLSQPAASPDGSRLAFYYQAVSGPSGGVAVVDIDGGHLATFETSAGVALPAYWAPIDWSPDGHRLLFVDRSRGVPTEVVGDTSTGTMTRLTLPAGVGADSGSWSHDGRRILVRTIDGPRTGLGLIDADGANFREITTRDGIFDNFDYGGPRWSPDGSTIAYYSTPLGSQDHDIFTITPDGSTLTQITNTPADEFWPIWSPDGRHLAWESTSSANSAADDEVVVADAFGGHARIMTPDVPGAAFATPFFSWSRDGTKLMISSCLDAQNCDLVELDAFGAAPPVHFALPKGSRDFSWGSQR